MGYCIGVGNLWRFPYLCGKYGGGAFVIAYLIMLLAVAGPLFFYESVLGQKFQRGPAETFRKMAPRWVGVSYIPVVMTLFFLPYYQLIVAYALHYFLASFQSPLPWVDKLTPESSIWTMWSSTGSRTSGLPAAERSTGPCCSRSLWCGR
ncbi:unnamed protein product [Prorocentrum cordatum]|nr:unnamed protein product [Polarella glacialis]